MYLGLHLVFMLIVGILALLTSNAHALPLYGDKGESDQTLHRRMEPHENYYGGHGYLYGGGSGSYHGYNDYDLSHHLQSLHVNHQDQPSASSSAHASPAHASSVRSAPADSRYDRHAAPRHAAPPSPTYSSDGHKNVRNFAAQHGYEYTDLISNNGFVPFDPTFKRLYNNQIDSPEHSPPTQQFYKYSPASTLKSSPARSASPSRVASPDHHQSDSDHQEASSSSTNVKGKGKKKSWMKKIFSRSKKDAYGDSVSSHDSDKSDGEWDHVSNHYPESNAVSPPRGYHWSIHGNEDLEQGQAVGYQVPSTYWPPSPDRYHSAQLKNWPSLYRYTPGSSPTHNP